MKLKKLDLVENLVGRIFFATFYVLMTFPWAYLFLKAVECRFSDNLIWYFLAAILVGTFITDLSRKVKGRYSLIVVFISFLISGFVLAGLTDVARLPSAIVVFNGYMLTILPMFGYLLLGYIRFSRLSHNNAHFMHDLSIGSGIMLVNIFLKDTLYPVSNTQILLFFIIGVSFAIYQKYLNVQGDKRDSSSWITIVLAVIGFITLISVLFTYGLSLKTLTIILLPLTLFIKLITTIISKVMYGVLFILSPLIHWFYEFLQKIRRVEEQEPQETEMGEVKEMIKEVDDWGLVGDLLGFFFRAVIVIAVIWFLYYLIKRFKPDEEKEFQSYQEIRESIFDPDDLKNDLKNFFNSIKDRFSGKNGKKSIYDGSTNLLKVREVYYNLVKEINHLVPFKTNYTPREFLAKLTNNYPEQKESLDNITGIYEKARYKLKATNQEVEEIKEEYQSVERDILRDKE